MRHLSCTDRHNKKKTMRLTTLFFICLTLNCFSGTEIKRIGSEFVKTKEEVDPNLIGRQAIYKFTIKQVNENLKSALIQYSIDGKEFRVTLVDFSFEVLTLKGKHKFIIYINDDYNELYSDSLEINSQCKDSYNVYPTANMRGVEMIVDKPVIYLYPEIEQEVKVEVTPVGEMLFTYPRYDGGWNVIAQPDGTIEHKGTTYNYLFWESKQIMHPEQIGSNGGFIVEKANLLAFIEDKLDEAGFTSKEKADFITFWVPRMLSYDELFIEFFQGDQCNTFAELKITPLPDHVNRFYMSWGVYNSDSIVTPHKIEKMDRTGFDVLEWGGQQIITKKLSETL